MQFVFMNCSSLGGVQGKTPIIETQELRRKLGVLDGEYKMIADFKKRVFEPSIKQINEHTDITVKSEQHKTGRSITGFSFRFKQKAQPKLEQKPTLKEIQTHLISLSK